MDVREVLATKRDGGELTSEQIEHFLSAYVAGETSDAHAAALLMAIFVRGMGARETADLTRGMLESGTRLSFESLGKPVVDKHSTGGVGDKVSIPLAPALAACGVVVPMISGRGLGHTGGTLDKLESIPGLTTELSEERIQQVAAECGLVFAAQTERLVPADAKLYALRDTTGLIGSVPLIASSILSKKLAEGLGALVLDVKFGSGAFLPEPARGAELARAMLAIAASFGVRTTVYQTSMARPLGRTAGNALEIAESIECLRGAGPSDLRALVCLLGGELLHLAGVVSGRGRGSDRIADALADGSALARFRRVVELQGGDARCVDQPRRLPRTGEVFELSAAEAGHLRWTDVRSLGRAAAALGGGRTRMGEAIDPRVGLEFVRPEGERVLPGDALVRLHHAGGRGLDQAEALVRAAYSLHDSSPPPPLVLARLGGLG